MRGHVSACLCIHNEEEMLPRCLRYLNSVPAIGEICVLDSGSTDGTVNILKSWSGDIPLNYSHREFTTFSEQRNACAEIAKGPWLITIDADETYTAPVAGLLMDLAKRTDIDAVRLCTRILWPDEGHYLRDDPDDPHCRIMRKGKVFWRRPLHEIPVHLDGRCLHTYYGNGVLCCWESEKYKECFLLHGQLLKTPQALDKKVTRWQELGWLEKSVDYGLPVKPDHWIQSKKNAALSVSVPLPSSWL